MGRNGKIMEQSQTKYINTGAFFAFALSTTYLPLVLGIGNQSGGGGGVVAVFGVLVIGIANYIYIYMVRNSFVRRLNLLLIPLNIIIVWFVLPILRRHVEGNVFAFSIIFLLLPWLVLMVSASLIHQNAIVAGRVKSGSAAKSGNLIPLRHIRPVAIMLSLACFSFLYFTYMAYSSTITRLMLHMHLGLGIINRINYFFWVIPGLIAALIGRRSEILHGAVFGMLSVVVAGLGQIIAKGELYPLFFYWVFIFMKASVLGSIGGFIGYLYHRLSYGNENPQSDNM